MNDFTKIFGTFLTVGLLLTSFNHCVLEETSNPSNPSNPTNNVINPPAPSNNTGGDTVVSPPAPAPQPVIVAPPPAVVQNEEVDIGVKNFEQINATMSVLTGVDQNSNVIQNTYEELETQLPEENDIKSFLSANQVAITKLAAEYCNSLVDSGDLRTNVWPNLNFGQGPNQVLANDNQRRIVVDQTLDSFWGSNVEMNTRSQSQTEMMSLFNDLLAGENLNDRNTTRTVVKGICTAALSSAQVTLM